MASQPLPVIAITPGEPAGIGPDLLVQLAQRPRTNAIYVAIADPELLQQRAAQLNLPLSLHEYNAAAPITAAGQLNVLPIPLATTATCGVLNSTNAAYVLATLQRATEGCMSGAFQALVTGPVHKGIINQSGVPFSGHTEYLAEQTDTEQVVMMLATEGLRVALATTHLPLRNVADAITAPLLEKVIRILHRDMQEKYGIAQPRILVCGLNPHAGEDGHLGTEERDIITPVLDKLRQQGIDLSPALPADTLFVPRYLESADAVLAMYHDQGLPVLKHKGFGRAINVTLGLPIIRTSVDHGTALELAGTGHADSGSLEEAINAAIDMSQRRREPNT